jgi:hypothetical protein
MYDERTRYVGVATEAALQGVQEALQERGLGRLESWENVEDEQGDWLKLIFESSLHGSARIRYSRLLLPTTGPDKDPETAGMIFSASFEERVRTRTPIQPPGSRDDVLTL